VIRERVIERLHLGHTSLPKPGRRPAGRDIAHGYELVDGALRDLSGVDSSMAGAGGGHAMLTTTEDLSRFMRALFAGRLFRRHATMEELHEYVAATGDGLTGYGLGVEHYDLPGGVEMVGHMGSSAGSRALMVHLPAQDIDITMIITSRGDPLPVLMPTLELLLAG
jgi:D-alanyl-D-alanine carboxypeptidase